MTVLEIILIIYIAVSQIFTFMILSLSSRKHRNIIIILLFIANPLGTITLMILSYIDDKKTKNLKETKE